MWPIRSSPLPEYRRIPNIFWKTRFPQYSFDNMSTILLVSSIKPHIMYKMTNTKQQLKSTSDNIRFGNGWQNAGCAVLDYRCRRYLSLDAHDAKILEVYKNTQLIQKLPNCEVAGILSGPRHGRLDPPAVRNPWTRTR